MDLSLWGAVTACLGLAMTFVLSLYAVDKGLPRNHPTTVRRRLITIITVCSIAPLYLWVWSDGNAASGRPILTVLGVRWSGVLPAAILPLMLVIVLYSGPIVQAVTTGEGMFEHITPERMDINIRNYLVAPFAEEFVFRACMVPLLLPHLGQLMTILLCPLFFGLAHGHHLVEWARRGTVTLMDACVTTLGQILYTSIFGMFSAFLFIRTGHLVSPVLSHALCNMMGLPSFWTVPEHKYHILVGLVYIAGLCGFIMLLFPLTQPELFS